MATTTKALEQNQNVVREHTLIINGKPANNVEYNRIVNAPARPVARTTIAPGNNKPFSLMR